MTITQRIAVIGAGFGGIGAAIRLRQAGFDDVTIFEREGSLGGVWRDNTYPGAACDVPSYLYSYSFAPKYDWSRRYAGQEEIRAYIEKVADDFGIVPLIRFNEPIESAVWNESAHEWGLTRADGSRESFDVVIFACGQMSQPLYPTIPGRESFGGTEMHSARWDHSKSLAGLDVAVIGTGASAIQFVPEVAAVAGTVTVFQRSPTYVTPKPDPVYARPMTRVQFWSRRYGLFLKKELTSVRFSRFPKLFAPVERAFLKNLETEVPDPVLRQKLTPTDRFGCKRLLVSDFWYPALNRANVDVETGRIARIEPGGVVTEDGTSHPADVILYGTGFHSTRFMLPFEIVGAGGVRLDDAWEVGAQAYLGVQVHGFPNLFMIYGPNSNVGHNSILFMIESQISYIVSTLRRLRRHGHSAVDVDGSTFTRFNDSVQKRSLRSVYATGCSNWFINVNGVHTQNWPGSVIPFWWRTRWARKRHLVEV